MTFLVKAIQALALAVTAMRLVLLTQKVFGHFAPNDPFDLAPRSGLSAYITVSTPLNDIWDSNVATSPSFVVALSMRANEGK